MTKIMFVCHGNICRSPMAELIMKKLVSERGLENDFLIVSSATSTEEIGNPIYPPAKRELARHGLSDDSKYAVQLCRDDYDKYDYFICMDSRNIRNALLIFRDDPDSKLSKLMSYTGSDRDVSDPWYTGEFEITYTDIYEGCTAFLDFLIK